MRGWILDAYPDYARDEIVVWVKKKGGGVRRLTDKFVPSFYVSSNGRNDINSLIRELAFSSSNAGVSREKNQRQIDGRMPENLLKIDSPRYSELSGLAKKINKDGEFSRYRLYNVDIAYGLRYFILKKISPMLMLSIEGAKGVLRYKALESSKLLCYKLPELRRVEIKKIALKKTKVASPGNPLKSVTLLSEGEEWVLDGVEEEVLLGLAAAIKHLDPDIIYSNQSALELSYLYHRAGECGLEEEFQLGRAHSVQRKKEGKTYSSYGRTLYKPPSYSLKGRLYIDGDAFLYRESGIHGLLDLARFSGIPLQLLSRMSSGNAITTMQLRHAILKNILIPWKKQNPEYFKSAWKLLHSDRGGYIFDPKVGIYDNVAELDFASMYPNIMVEFNISPETVLCPCCKNSNHIVPVLGYNICEKRRGLVPEVLKPVIERRFAYKRLMKHVDEKTAEQYRERQAILKWLLITSFGYQGYRNARFGRIEAHETICAYGRELLLKAKEIVEHFGFEVLHGLVDSLWVKREASVRDLEALCKRISTEIGIDINLEGRYRWIVFLPNRSTHVGALNRYYGVFEDGSRKARGIEMRMRDTPTLISAYQKEVLKILSRAQGVEEFHSKIGGVFKVLRKYAASLSEGRIDPRDLVFTVYVSRRLSEYRVKNFSYAALRQLKDLGADLLPGQPVRYVVADKSSRSYSERVKLALALEKGDSYDSEFYIDRLLRATESLLLPFGYKAESLAYMLKGQKQSNLIEFYRGTGYC
jgi:DNA polymerase elongation subunit (family B)